MTLGEPADAAVPMVETRGLGFHYPLPAGERGGQAATNHPPALFIDFDWSVRRGETWAVVGPSGCGKTTLLYLLAGLRAPTAGQIRVAGQAVSTGRRQTGLILQDHGLLPWATAAENAGLGLRVRGVPAAERRRIVGEWLDRLGIAEAAARYPAQLSGGQRQRVAVARALALEPDLLLMDEPFASLDALTREESQEMLIGLTVGRPNPPTVVLVTHDIAEAVLLGQHVLVLTSPPIHRAEVFENPEAGNVDYRARPEFHAMTQEIRRAVIAARGSSAAARPSGGTGAGRGIA